MLLKNKIIIIFLVLALIPIGFFIKQGLPYKFSKNIQSQSLELKLDKESYRQNEPIAFTITNNTFQNVYYFPETCASNLVRVFDTSNNENVELVGDPIVCLLAPSVVVLPPNESVTGTVSKKILAKMTQGSYKLQFTYSLEMTDRFALGERSTIDSDTFAVVEAQETSSGIYGIATVGPTCGGPQKEDQECISFYEGIIVVKNQSDQKIVTKFETSTDGSFRVSLPPGVYVLETDSNNPPPFLSQMIEVKPYEFSEIVITLGSGML